MRQAEIRMRWLDLPLVRIAIIACGGENDMIQKGYLHEFGGLFHPFGQSVILSAGPKIAGGMVVAEHQTGGQGIYTGFQDETYIDGGLGDTALADLDFTDHFVVAVEGGYPKLLVRQVA